MEASFLTPVFGVTFENGVIHIKNGTILENKCGFCLSVSNRKMCFEKSAVQMIEDNQHHFLWRTPSKAN